MKRFIFSTCLALAFAPAFAQSVEPVGYDDPVLGAYRSLVFNKGDFESGFYRIPAIETLPDGTLIAVADKRIERLQDLPGKIDVVCRRSTDGGRTWSDYITIAANDSIGGYGDPALIYDPKHKRLVVVCTHGNGLWQTEPGHITVFTSADGGLTWSEPLDLNPMLFAPGNIEAVSAFATSGRAIVTKSGRIIFVLVTRRDGVEKFPCYAIYSDDGGLSWKISDTPVTDDGDETKIVQLPDGTLLASIRNRWVGDRRVSRSTDNGRTWTVVEPFGLHDIACNGDILSYRYEGTDYLIQSLPDGPWRDNITLYASSDGGRTWPKTYRVSPGPGAYSAMTVMPDGSIGVLTEEGVHDVDARHLQGYRIWFTRVPIELLLK